VLLLASSCFALYTLVTWAIDQFGTVDLASPVAAALMPLLHALSALF
jgi:hypothetical protein